MNTRIYYESDADPSVLRGRTIAVIGYGNQGQAHARNLRDSGFRVIVGQRPGGPGDALAREHGFEPVRSAEAARQADLVILALPDEAAPAVFNAELAAQLRPGQAVGFLHGFNIRFGLIRPPVDVDVIMIAPKGPGTLVREAFARGGGLACILAVHQDASGRAKAIALAWGAGIGGGRGGMFETTFAAECEADLFGEQVVLCGGMIELMNAAFETLVEAGCPEELAYLECVHEMKQIADLVYTAGLSGMRERISATAAYGGLTRGPRLISEQTKASMRAILEEIRSGRFAEEWMTDAAAGRARLRALAEAERGLALESAGRRVRDLIRNAWPKE